MTAVVDEARLDDVAAMEAADPGQMLRALASGAAQVRESALRAVEAGVGAMARDGRPRAIVVTGMGGSAFAGEVLAAVAGTSCPVPIVVHRGFGLPGWVGAADLVAAVSCSGATAETLSAFDEAARRGARLLAVGCAGSPLAARAEQARATFVPVDPGGRKPRANLWALAMPLVLVGDALGLLAAPDAVIEATAAMLELVALRLRPSSESFVNPAKALALELAGGLPMCWGTSAVSGIAAARLAAQLNENAKCPAIAGVLPEAAHNQVVAFDGPFAGTRAEADLFRDRLEEHEPVRLRLLLLRDVEEQPEVARRAEQVRDLAVRRGVAVSEHRAEGDTALVRLGSLIGLVDFVSVYVGLLVGVDPTPIAAIDELKARVDT